MKAVFSSLLLLAFSAGAWANVPDAEAARSELLRFSERLRAVPGTDDGAASSLQEQLRHAKAEEVLALHALVDRSGGWKLAEVAAEWSREGGDDIARRELLQFIEDLRSVSGVDEGTADETRAAFATAPAAMVNSIYRALEPVRGWQKLPSVLEEVSNKVEEQKAARVQRAIDVAINGKADPEWMRRDLLFFISILRSFSPVAGPDLERHLGPVERTILTASPAELEIIQRVIVARAAAFQLGTNSSPGAGLRPALHAEPCDSICSDDPFGICDAICGGILSGINTIRSGLESAIASLNSTITDLRNQVNGLITQVTNLANQVSAYVAQFAQFVTDAFNKTAALFSQLGSVVNTIADAFTNLYNRISSVLTGFWDTLKALVPTTPEAAFQLLTQIDLSNTSWVDTLVSRFPVLEAPCPAYGTDAGPLGIVGSLAAAQKSDGFAKVTKIFYDLAPKDVAGIKLKLLAASAYHPAEYWNLCVRSRYAIHEYEEESAHRAHLTTNLNVPLSSRATQASVNAVSASLNDVDADVTRAEGKLTALAPKSDELLRRLDQHLSTRARQVSLDDWRASIGNLDRDVARVESKLDALQLQVNQERRNETDFQAAAASFETLMTRLSIENNLLENDNRSIAQYQLPASFGGQLELVRSIVQKTFTALAAAGQPINNAQKDFVRGEALMTAGQFLNAYKEFRKAYSEAVKP